MKLPLHRCLVFAALLAFALTRATAQTETKLPNDTLTLTEAKAFVAAHEAERAKLETERKKVLKDGAKATPAERAKLIAKFRTEQKERIKQIQEQAPRAQDLTKKIKDAEKSPGNPGHE